MNVTYRKLDAGNWAAVPIETTGAVRSADGAAAAATAAVPEARGSASRKRRTRRRTLARASPSVA